MTNNQYAITVLHQTSALELRRKLLQNLTKRQLELELSLHNLRIERMKTKLQRFFNSTPTRHAFARLMTLGAYRVNDDPNFIGYTKTDASKILHISLQSCSTLFDTTLASKWIERYNPEGEVNSSKQGYIASEELVHASELYVDTFFQITSSDLIQNWQNLRQFDKITTTYL
jgi:hypothetical protein